VHVDGVKSGSIIHDNLLFRTDAYINIMYVIINYWYSIIMSLCMSRKFILAQSHCTLYKVYFSCLARTRVHTHHAHFQLLIYYNYLKESCRGNFSCKLSNKMDGKYFAAAFFTVTVKIYSSQQITANYSTTTVHILIRHDRKLPEKASSPVTSVSKSIPLSFYLIYDNLCIPME
jgi:hypothetical protein